MNKTIKALAGQRLMLGCDGPDLSADLKAMIREFMPAGIILFRQNIRSAPQLQQLCRDIRDYAAQCHLPRPIIACDQEGGQVARLWCDPYTQFPGNPHIHTPEDADAFAAITARELSGAGITMNMAPVLDVAPPSGESVMAGRVFPGDAHRVAELGTRVIAGLQARGVMAVAKHFPGIGRTVLDSHLALPVLDESLETLTASDLIPFAASIGAGVTGIMLSHIFYPRLDSQWQASLSPAIARDLLRGRMKFEGLVLTDDLDMKAISRDMATCMAQVLASDIDLVLICHTGPAMADAFGALVTLLSDSPELQARGQRSRDRVRHAVKTVTGQIF